MQLAEANKRSKARPAPATAAKQPGASGWRVRLLHPVFLLATSAPVRAATSAAGSPRSRTACTAANAARGYLVWLSLASFRQACPAWAPEILLFYFHSRLACTANMCSCACSSVQSGSWLAGLGRRRTCRTSCRTACSARGRGGARESAACRLQGCQRGCRRWQHRARTSMIADTLRARCDGGSAACWRQSREQGGRQWQPSPGRRLDATSCRQERVTVGLLITLARQAKLVGCACWLFWAWNQPLADGSDEPRPQCIVVWHE